MTFDAAPQAPVPAPVRKRRGCRYFLNLLIFAVIVFILIIQLRSAYAGYQEVAGVLYPVRSVFCCDTPADANIPYEDVQIQTQDGLTLAGWYLLPQSDASILMVHGAGGNRISLWRLAVRLHEQGYGILLLEMRGHGASEGTVFTRGWLDILAGVQYLGDKGVQKIGAYGFSLGATMVIQAAAQTTDIRSVVVDGASPVEVSDVPLPNTLLGWLYELYDVVYWTQLQARSEPLGGFSLRSTHDAVALISPRPIFFIAAGAEASLFEARTVEAFYASAHLPKSLWIIDDVYHGGGFDQHLDDYTQRVAGFFDDTLQPSTVS